MTPVWDATMEAVDWEVALEVDLMLTYGDRRMLPNLSTIELEAETQVVHDLSFLPDYASGVRPGWREYVAAGDDGAAA